MDHSPEKGTCFSLLGKFDTCHFGRTVHGGRWDLWCRHFHSVSGEKENRSLINLIFSLTDFTISRNRESLVLGKKHGDVSCSKVFLDEKWSRRMWWIYICFVQEDILSLWNRTSSELVTRERIRDTLKRVLNLPANTIMEYKAHMDSLKLVNQRSGQKRNDVCE